MAEAATRESPAVDDDDYRGNYHVYVPYRAGLPRVKPYLRELWRRREFLNEMARADIRARNMDTWLGRIWNVLSPVLSGLTYYLLVLILLRGADIPHYFAYLMAGVFLFEIVDDAMGSGTKSVVSAGRMITNTAFPKLLLPLSTIRTSVAQFWPMLIVLALACAVDDVRPSWALLACIPIFIFYVILCCGIAMILATLQVYFRDTKGFVPFFSRLLFFGSPVLWVSSTIPLNLKAIEVLNPMFPIVATWSNAIVLNQWPPTSAYLVAAAWAFGFLLVGSYIFISRERDFAVRI